MRLPTMSEKVGDIGAAAGVVSASCCFSGESFESMVERGVAVGSIVELLLRTRASLAGVFGRNNVGNDQPRLTLCRRRRSICCNATRTLREYRHACNIQKEQRNCGASHYPTTCAWSCVTESGFHASPRPFAFTSEATESRAFLRPFRRLWRHAVTIASVASRSPSSARVWQPEVPTLTRSVFGPNRTR